MVTCILTHRYSIINLTNSVLLSILSFLIILKNSAKKDLSD